MDLFYFSSAVPISKKVIAAEKIVHNEPGIFVPHILSVILGTEECCETGDYIRHLGVDNCR